MTRPPCVVTIGNFDGVHRGHRRLVATAVAAARERGVKAIALTFDPHPASALRPHLAPPRLTDLAARRELLLAAGVDDVVVLPFTIELSQLDPEAFVQQVVVEQLAAVEVVVGVNFRFGHRAAGDAAALTQLGVDRASDGFAVTTVDLFEVDGAIVSTSAIRAALQRGDVEFAIRALGRPYELRGSVIKGDGRGRTIGVPTANLRVAAEVVLPANGVYAGHLTLDDGTPMSWPAVTNVGVRPTIDTQDAAVPTVETHVLDMHDDLYGREVNVSFTHRLRDERRFDDLDALVTQIQRDIADARRLLGRAG